MGKEKSVFIKPEDLTSFLKERKAMKDVFNEELRQLQAKMIAAAENNKESILFSIPMTNTLIQLSKETLDNLFSSVKEHYPEHGLFLEEIQIIHKENVGAGSNYFTSIIIKFLFNNEKFNNTWNSFGLDGLSFNDEKLGFIDNSMGVCLDPKFVDSEKYHYAQKEISEAKAKLAT